MINRIASHFNISYFLYSINTTTGPIFYLPWQYCSSTQQRRHKYNPNFLWEYLIFVRLRWLFWPGYDQQPISFVLQHIIITINRLKHNKLIDWCISTVTQQIVKNSLVWLLLIRSSMKADVDQCIMQSLRSHISNRRTLHLSVTPFFSSFNGRLHIDTNRTRTSTIIQLQYSKLIDYIHFYQFVVAWRLALINA